MAVDIWKILRSLTPDNRPSGRTYGEVYVNLGDNQLGVFDNSNVARDLIGVPYFSSAKAYSVGNAVNFQGQLYIAIAAVSAGTWNPTQWSPVISQSGRVGSGILVYQSATSLAFFPSNGDLIMINGRAYPIPYAGIAGLSNTGVYVNGVAGQNLSGSVFYYVYCFNNGGVLTADFRSTGGHQTSSTPGNIGTEISGASGGDDTRSLIGACFTGGPGDFHDTQNSRCVRSWFNRRLSSTHLFVNVPSSSWNTSSTWSALTSANFIGFGGDILDVTFDGTLVGDTVAGYLACSIGIDTQSPTAFSSQNSLSVISAGAAVPFSIRLVYPFLGDGFHTVYPIVFSTGANGQLGGAVLHGAIY